MKKFLAGLVFCFALLPTLVADVVATNQPSLASLSWLAGNWRSAANGRELTEQWMLPAGGTMLGMSRTVVRGKTVDYEFLLLRETNGAIEFVAKPSGQAEATFKLIRASKAEVVFENPQHDFPQRIRYALQADGQLTAAIEGTQNGQPRRVEFQYQRSPSERK